jgi:hypothetical protein
MRDLASPFGNRRRLELLAASKNRRATARDLTYKVLMASPEMARPHLQYEILNAVAKSDLAGSPLFVPNVEDNERTGETGYQVL